MSRMMSDKPQDPYEPGQRWGDADWGSWRPTRAQRAAGGLIAVALPLFAANHGLKWGLLGKWSGPAVVAAYVISLVVVLRILPSSARRRL